LASAAKGKPLDAEWVEWLYTNMARGRPLDELRGIMRGRGFDEDSMAAAIANAPRVPAPRPASASRPPADPIPLARLNLPGAIAHGGDRAELYVVDAFLTPGECDTITRLILAQLRPSTTTTPAGAAYDATFRTSRTCDLDDSIPAVARLEAKICAAVGFDRSLTEPTQGQHYEPGQVFRTHTDFFKPYELDKFATVRHGQRTWTFMVYLHEPEGGGETEFPELGLKIAPKLGRAVLWNNLLASGEGNHSTQHQSLPVTAGTKTIITKWFRVPRRP
jgi:prolyl 4-hydroxylase